MKLISSRLALQPAILAFLFAAAGHAEERGTAAIFAARVQCQVGILQNLPRAFGARLSWILSHATTCGAAARVHRKSVAGLYRA